MAPRPSALLPLELCGGLWEFLVGLGFRDEGSGFGVVFRVWNSRDRDV